MKIIHTSDLHLAEDRPETLKALTEVLQVCRRESVDLLTIAGDLFDSEADADTLRPRIREVFSGNDFSILAIPGNHDRDAYQENLDFGSNLEVMVQEPLQTVRMGDVLIAGVPYAESPDDGLLEVLAKASSKSEVSVLLLHCTLDLGFKREEFGKEEIRYFPVTLPTLSGLGFNYILAGHFHSQTYKTLLSNGGTFVYPGSPVSHTTRELGRRQVVYIDTLCGKFRTIPLKTFYRDRLDLVVTPGKEMQALERLEEWVGERSSDDCALEVVVRGYIQIDEREFADRLNSLKGRVSIRREYRNVNRVLEHPLFKRFSAKLDASDVDEKERVQSMVLDVMSKLLADRRLSP